MSLVENSSRGMTIRLPSVRRSGGMPVEQAIELRRSVREYTERSISLQELSQLLWAAQGLCEGSQRRTVPSAGALYPLRVWAAAGNVQELESGVYLYLPPEHSLEMVRAGDVRRELGQAAWNQTWLSRAPVVLLISADYSITARKYHDRAIRYVHMEVGHAGQNVSLQALSLGLATVMVGAFDDDRVQVTTGIPGEQTPLYLIPVGHGLVG